MMMSKLERRIEGQRKRQISLQMHEARRVSVRRLQYQVSTCRGPVSAQGLELYDAGTALAHGYSLGLRGFWWVEAEIGD